MEKKSSDSLLEEILIKRNIAVLSKSFEKVVDDKTPAGKYFIHTRKISVQTVKQLNIFSLQGKFKQEFLKDDVVKTRTLTLNCAVTPLYDHMQNIVGISLIHVDNQGKKDAKKGEHVKQVMHFSSVRIAQLQHVRLSNTVYLAEGVETVASVVDILKVKQEVKNFCFLASLGIDNFPAAMSYIKTNFPPDTTIVLLKDHDKTDSPADIKFWQHYAEFCKSNFNIVVREPAVEDFDWNDVLQQHAENPSELFNQFAIESAIPKNLAYHRTEYDDSLLTVVPVNTDQTLYDAFVKVQQALNENYLSQRKDQLLSSLNKQIIYFEDLLKKDNAKEGLTKIEFEIEKIKYLLTMEYEIKFTDKSVLANENAEKHKLVTKYTKESEEKVNNLDEMEKVILDKSEKQSKAIEQLGEFLKKYFDYPEQNKLEVIETEVRKRINIARERKWVFPFEMKVEEYAQEVSIIELQSFVDGLKQAIQKQDYDTKQKILDILKQKLSKLPVTSLEKLNVEDFEKILSLKITAENIRIVVDGLNKAIDEKDSVAKQKFLDFAVEKSLKLPIAILEKLDIEDLEKLPLEVLEDLPVVDLLEEIMSETFYPIEINNNSDEKKANTLYEKMKYLTKDKILSCCIYQKYILNIDIPRAKKFKTDLDEDYKVHKLLELQKTVEILKEKAEAKTTERNLQHQAIDANQSTLGKNYLSAISMVAGNKILLQLWIQGAFSDLAVASPVLYSQFENAKLATVEKRDSDEFTTVCALREILWQKANVSEEQKQQDVIYFYSLEFAGQLYQSLEFEVERGFRQEFDGIVIRDGSPVIMERKTSDGTGEGQLLLNFINGKLLAKEKFYKRLAEVGDKLQEGLDSLLKEAKFFIKGISDIKYDDLPDNFTEKLMQAAKLLAIEALLKKVFEFTLNQPKNLASDLEIEAPQDMSVTVRFSVKDKGNESTSIKLVTDAIKQLIESKKASVTVVTQPETSMPQNDLQTNSASTIAIHGTYSFIAHKLEENSHTTSDVVHQNNVLAEQSQHHVQPVNDVHVEIKHGLQFFATAKKEHAVPTTQLVTDKDTKEKDSKEKTETVVEQKGSDAVMQPISLNNTKR